MRLKFNWKVIVGGCLALLIVSYLLPFLVVTHALKSPHAAVFDAKTLIVEEIDAFKDLKLSPSERQQLSACLAHLTASALKQYARQTGNVILKPDQAVYGAVDITQSIKRNVIAAMQSGSCNQSKRDSFGLGAGDD